MPSVVVLVLIGLWGAVLLPPLVRHRPARPPRVEGAHLATSVLTRRPVLPTTVDSVADLTRVGRVDPAARTGAEAGEDTPADVDHAPDALMPRSATEAHRRRLMVMATLVAMAVVALAAVPLVGPLALVAHVGSDLALAGYAWLVVERQQRARQRVDVVRSLNPTRRVQPGFMVDERFLDRGRRAG